MAVNRISAETLIGLAVASLRDDIVPALPADKRYAAAMVANALEIARREIKAEGDPAIWTVLDSLYEEGEGTPARLAADIRHGKFTEESNPGLGKSLFRVLEAELAITKPGFLAARKA